MSKSIENYRQYLNSYNEPALINLAAYDYFLKATGQKALTKKEKQQLYDFECKRLESIGGVNG